MHPGATHLLLHRQQLRAYGPQCVRVLLVTACRQRRQRLLRPGQVAAGAGAVVAPLLGQLLELHTQQGPRGEVSARDCLHAVFAAKLTKTVYEALLREC